MNAKWNYRLTRSGLAFFAVFACLSPVQAQTAYPTTNASSASAGDRYAQPAAIADLSAVRWLVDQADKALAAGDLAKAEKLTADASKMNIPEQQFGKGELTPAKMAWKLTQARNKQNNRMVDSQVMTAGGSFPVTQGGHVAQQALHMPAQDSTQVKPAAALIGPALSGANQPSLAQPRLAQLPSPFKAVPTEQVPAGPTAQSLLAEGETALRNQDNQTAFEKFQAASQKRAELSAGDKQRLERHLRMLAVAAPAPAKPAPVAVAPEAVPSPFSDSMIDSVEADQKVLARQLSTTVGQVQVESREIRTADPRRSLEMLEEVRKEVEDSGLAEEYKSQLIVRINRSVADTKKYIEDNRSQIELDEQNAAVLAEVQRDQATKLKVQETIADQIKKFNELVDEQRFEEAEIIAMRLREIAPNDPVVAQVWANAKLIRRNMMNDVNREAKENMYWSTLERVDNSAGQVVPDNGIHYDEPSWDGIRNRTALSDANATRSRRELEIEKRLDTPVKYRCDEKPLGAVMEELSEIAGVNIHLDQTGLAQEGVTSSTPISFDATVNEISVRSALNLILEQYELGYVIKDEVLKVTSLERRDGDLVTKPYYVADLVVPIPNFVPDNNIGLQGLINDAMAAAGNSAAALNPRSPITSVIGANGGVTAADNILPQNFSNGGPFTGSNQPITTGPGGLGGAASADFDSLIDLIVQTVASDTWAENGGGEAEISPFPTNLSLVISQTQSVHEEIADLLEQLRRLQDLQVTIEVRFIRLSDDFFERIGIDFDMNINDMTDGFDDIAAGGIYEGPRSSGTVGTTLSATGDLPAITADLDLPFRQGSFDVAVPTFGGFNPTQAATFGFAILSDIEAYFLINAAQGDSRTNVLNAPKVTLFNGQQAFVSDTSQSPFVISVIPVVGEFAAAQQPVIVVLSEGTLMSIQAVVSDDRRYVRLTVVPFFSEIGDVDTFTFDGQTTTNNSTSSSSTDADDDGVNESASNANDNNTVVAGTTVQLPTFQFVSVTTTVSVPDGGTVLLGGIKRLSEGRQEFGVPLLSKVPYINRLFRNVGIGRETNSLMMMVTPRIIIQEEEEERLGIAAQ